MVSTQRKGRDVHLNLRLDLYEQVAALAQEHSRTVTAQVEVLLRRGVHAPEKCALQETCDVARWRS